MSIEIWYLQRPAGGNIYYGARITGSCELQDTACYYKFILESSERTLYALNHGAIVPGTALPQLGFQINIFGNKFRL